MPELDRTSLPEHQLKDQLSDPDNFIGQVGEDAAKQVETFLEKHSDLISKETARQIIEVEQTTAANTYRQARIEGRANDNENRIPGLRIYVDAGGVDDLRKMAGTQRYILPEVQEVVPGKQAVYVCELPEATYAVGSPHLRSPADSLLGFSLREGEKLAYALLPKNVVRIEGIRQPTLWQNPQYNWDLTLKEDRT